MKQKGIIDSNDNFKLDLPINVSFDTNIFDAWNYKLSEGSEFDTLVNYVKEGYINVILSNIVVNEIKNHCIEKSYKIVDSIKSCEEIIQKLNLTYNLDTPDKKKLKSDAEMYVDELLKKMNASVMDYNGVSIEKIFDDYFNRIPPFEEKKKSEFPDAVIVMQIKQKINKDFPIYLITKDEGVKRALEGEEYCSIHNSLSEVFDKLSKYKADKAEYDKIVSILKGFYSDIAIKIKEKFEKEPEKYITRDLSDLDEVGIIAIYKHKEICYNAIKIEPISLINLEYFNDKEIRACFRCNACIKAECRYYDINYSVLDLGENEYTLPNAGNSIEMHDVSFWCLVRVDRSKKEILNADFNIDLRMSSKKTFYNPSDLSTPYDVCPDCGEAISHLNDGGNGFCINCAPNH